MGTANLDMQTTITHISDGWWQQVCVRKAYKWWSVSVFDRSLVCVAMASSMLAWWLHCKWPSYPNSNSQSHTERNTLPSRLLLEPPLSITSNKNLLKSATFKPAHRRHQPPHTHTHIDTGLMRMIRKMCQRDDDRRWNMCCVTWFFGGDGCNLIDMIGQVWFCVEWCIFKQLLHFGDGYATATTYTSRRAGVRFMIIQTYVTHTATTTHTKSTHYFLHHSTSNTSQTLMQHVMSAYTFITHKYGTVNSQQYKTSLALTVKQALLRQATSYAHAVARTLLSVCTNLFLMNCSNIGLSGSISVYFYSCMHACIIRYITPYQLPTPVQYKRTEHAHTINVMPQSMTHMLHDEKWNEMSPYSGR